ncbi:ABC transporter ATP-binding protein [Alpinimonas psychrophila]|uniref:ABC-2 type transport system ATP-binding protein n=1 Tax=Alpinimonas psychrophila TaxID=748908 RepID=A0A7W3JSG0_9MICO|nr:ABC transporter ATP-binding protein [Alpinimonas psychrophila]MBA8828411.1 ABC-2 type transport system ATP-binding protein [Alpinimonas psychrophila]
MDTMRGTSIEFQSITKSFGAVKAVSNLSFTVEPGVVTGFLGPNGAGKTTTLRMLLGLVRPTSGTATFAGAAYRDLPNPLSTVGTALEASSFHPGRTARNHLRVYAAAASIPRERVGTVLDLVGLHDDADRRVGGYSLGMRQRLGLAFALIGDPGVLVLDEPTNGLDPEGIRWMRGFLRARAAEGRTVLVSSHQLSEVQQSVDRVVIITRGEAVYEGSLAGLESGARVRVSAVDQPALALALIAAGAEVHPDAGVLVATGLTADEVGAAALAAGIVLSLLAPEHVGLEEAFLGLVGADPDPAAQVVPTATEEAR